MENKLDNSKRTKTEIWRSKMNWFNRYLDDYIAVWELKDKGLSVNQIAKELNMKGRQVTERWRAFKKIYLPQIQGGK